MAKSIVKTVRVAFGYRKLNRVLKFAQRPCGAYEIRMEGEVEFLRIYQPDTTKVMLQDTSWCDVRPGQWAASVMARVGGRIRDDGVLCVSGTAENAYVEALDYVSWR